MKKLSLLLLTLALTGFSSLFAQVEEVNVTAEIIGNIDFTTSPATVTFGNVLADQTATVSADPNGTNQNADNAQRATITIGGALSEQTFAVSFGNGTLSKDDDQTKTIAFTTALFLASGATTSGALNSSDSFTHASGETDIVLHVGGSLAAVPAADAGSYGTANAGGTAVTIDFAFTSI
ncbi:MAG: hypothetical protein ACNA78_02995 [Balneolaceae bacterium]